MQKKGITKSEWLCALLATGLLLTAEAAFAERTEARRLGAFAGAMKYCAERYDEKEGRYFWARQRVAREVDGMSGKNKLRAIAAGDHAFRTGRFLGDRLDRSECRTLLGMSEWRRFWR
ncbi:hypothetical protein [Chitinilyticum litopenaei]|uniref:hypothetical protein n=1 Tax=Chitinilyticum litopenaei TaxID=1121276 RepID=UPI000421609E|nr:hypothetical protein [Chitinilyticum litopenaei]